MPPWRVCCHKVAANHQNINAWRTICCRLSQGWRCRSPNPRRAPFGPASLAGRRRACGSVLGVDPFGCECASCSRNAVAPDPTSRIERRFPQGHGTAFCPRPGPASALIGGEPWACSNRRDSAVDNAARFHEHRIMVSFSVKKDASSACQAIRAIGLVAVLLLGLRPRRCGHLTG